MSISEILELNERAREDGKKFPRARHLLNEIQMEPGRHFTGIVGPRVVGKTVLIKQLANWQPDVFYISDDTLDELSLTQAAGILSEQYKIKTLLIDEIHFCGNAYHERL